MPRVLLVEDDRSLGRTLAERLEKESLDVQWVVTLAAARAAAEQGPWDLAIVDVMLPDGSGFDLVPESGGVRAHSDHVHDRTELRGEPVDWIRARRR